jgi:uncharacterized protein (TIGR03118 family)
MSIAAFSWRRVARLCAIPLVLFLSSSVWAQHFTRTDIVADMPSTSPLALNFDANLQNAWGLARASGSPWWVSDNGTGLTTLYNSSGALLGTFTIPGVNGDQAAPTGTAFNFSSEFLLPNGKKSIFLFVTEDGTISGWNGGPAAVIKVPRSTVASYKGVAIAEINGRAFLYATNFKQGTVEVFSGAFEKQPTAPNFMEPHLPRNYVPFGIQNIAGNIVVTYARKQPGATDEDHGPGLGYVAIFTPLGRMIAVLKHGDYFNAPWGITMAPGDFGTFSHRLLIGNFGDGTIHAFNPFTGDFEGTLLATGTSSPVVIDGLWALSFGNNATAGSAIELFFTAGPNDEANGVLGKLVPVASEQRGNGE